MSQLIILIEHLKGLFCNELNCEPLIDLSKSVAKLKFLNRLWEILILQSENRILFKFCNPSDMNRSLM